MEFNVEIDPNFDEIIDESTGNSFVALRRLRWNENSKFKLDIRKWYAGEEKEVAGKGTSISEEGADTLANVLVKRGYGKTDDIIQSISTRDDFLYNAKKTIDKMREKAGGVLKIEVPEDAVDEESFYDPKEWFGE
jgi:hypothetical protein